MFVAADYEIVVGVNQDTMNSPVVPSTASSMEKQEEEGDQSIVDARGDTSPNNAPQDVVPVVHQAVVPVVPRRRGLPPVWDALSTLRSKRIRGIDREKDFVYGSDQDYPQSEEKIEAKGNAGGRTRRKRK